MAGPDLDIKKAAGAICSGGSRSFDQEKTLVPVFSPIVGLALMAMAHPQRNHAQRN